MHDVSTSEKCAQLQEEVNILLQVCAGHPRIERQAARIRSTATDLQGRILHLEQKADAESESMQQLVDECGTLRLSLDSARQANVHLQELINSSYPNTTQEPD